MKYRAQFQRNGDTIQTHFYPTRKQAQDQLAKRIGSFRYLGTVSGDGQATDKRYCDYAPRNGGAVSIDERDGPSAQEIPLVSPSYHEPDLCMVCGGEMIDPESIVRRSHPDCWERFDREETQKFNQKRAEVLARLRAEID